MRKVGLVLACGLVFAACSGNNPFGVDGGGGSGDGQPGSDGGGLLPGGADDPIVCVGDPDTQVVCGRQSEMWDCDALPNGDVKCASGQQHVPAGDGTWECREQDGKIVCTTDQPGVDGGGGWGCTSDDVSTTCEKEMPAPLGGGAYDCSFSPDDFSVECTGSEPPPPPPEPPPPPPPGPGPAPTGGGTYICYQADPSVEGLPTPPEGWWAKLIGEKVLYNGVPALHVKLTLSKAFVDNTYGNWSIGYSGGAEIGGGHSFKDLLESDKAEIFVPDNKGNLLFHMALDYISESSEAPSGYGTLGVSGGDGKMIMGDEADVIATQTSLAVNFNGHGYHLFEDSPETDVNFTPNATYPKWIFELWYEAWINWSAFGDGGPGAVYITGLHASPSKLGQNKLPVIPGECP